jgi:hypothetical protein
LLRSGWEFREIKPGDVRLLVDFRNPTNPWPKNPARLGNAVVCGVISGPHDRCGARLMWVATLVTLIAALRGFSRDEAAREDSSSL